MSIETGSFSLDSQEANPNSTLMGDRFAKVDDHRAAFDEIIAKALKDLTLAPAERNQEGEVVVYGQFNPESITEVGEKLGWIADWMRWLGSEQPNRVLDPAYYKDVVQYINDAARFVDSYRRLLDDLKFPFSQMDGDLMLRTENNPVYYYAKIVTPANERVEKGRYIASPTGEDADDIRRVVHETEAVESRLRDVYVAGIGFYGYVEELRHRGFNISAEVNDKEASERMEKLFSIEVGKRWKGSQDQRSEAA